MSRKSTKFGKQPVPASRTFAEASRHIQVSLSTYLHHSTAKRLESTVWHYVLKLVSPFIRRICRSTLSEYPATKLLTPTIRPRMTGSGMGTKGAGAGRSWSRSFRVTREEAVAPSGQGPARPSFRASRDPRSALSAYQGKEH